MRRWANADDVARAILFLLSPAASYINGVLLPVDGGQTLVL
jgi:3-oxoacyl-[acyl-carrier protein] reductase